MYVNINELKKLVNSKNDGQRLLEQPFYSEIESLYVGFAKEKLLSMSTGDAVNGLISEVNFLNRAKEDSSIAFGDLQAGDICLIDFGKRYLRECAYCHMAMVISKEAMKVLVVPMTSSLKTYQKAMDTYNKKIYMNLIPIDIQEHKACNLDQNSSLFVNDAQFISASRVLKKIGTVCVESEEFKDTQKRLIEIVGRGLK